MASKGIINRDLARKALHAKHAPQRRALKEEIRQNWDNPQKVDALYLQLRKLPLNSSPTRLHNRDMVTGRPKAYMRKFGLSRITFRELALRGMVPGVVKSSW